MYTNPFNRKHSTIRQVLDRLLDPTRKPIKRSESVSSSGSNSSKGSNGSFGSSSSSSHGHRGILQWGHNQPININNGESFFNKLPPETSRWTESGVDVENRGFFTNRGAPRFRRYRLDATV